MTPPRPNAAPALAVVDLRCQLPPGVLAIGRDPVRLTWRVAPAVDGLVQEAYEVEASERDDFSTHLATTGVVESPEQLRVMAPAAELRSREVRFFRVRIRTAQGWTGWSPVLRVEAGLLDPSDWDAEAITLPDDPGRDAPSPSPLLRREFDVAGPIARARLYVTSLGLHRVAINGHPVSDDPLAPGWTTYRRRLIAETHDVTALLRPGPNVIAATLGDGWYRGRLGWSGLRAIYGRDVALIAQLEIQLQDGPTQRVVSDRSWLTATGEIRSADLYDGAVVDLRERRHGWSVAGFDASGWQPAAVVPFDPSILEPRIAPPVRVVATMPAEVIRRDGSRLTLDGGQNLTGHVRLRVLGRPGDTVSVRHAEVLEPDGSLHVRALRTARATDIYVLADEAETELEPQFTFHGFRYAEVETTADVLGAEIVAISSDTPKRSSFTSSDPDLNQLHENVVWSQRANFVSVPTDCPQRDERLGWTGDAQAFAPTASTLFDAEAFWESWLRDLALDQDDVRGVPSVVPDVVLDGEPRFGRAGWADAATIVPWSVYESYGDAEVLRRQLDSMERWVRSLERRREDDGLLGPGMQFGDWLDPDAPPDQPWLAKTDSQFLANAFFAQSARLLAAAATVLGRRDLAARNTAVAEEIAALTWGRWRDHARSTQAGCAVAIQFAIAPPEERQELGDALARLVQDGDGRVATGFLGTPLVLPALASVGRFDEAYQMLLRRASPSWLYQVAQGATTVWERWDAILPDGSIHSGRMAAPPGMPESAVDDIMLSFNHYAYGAVIDWVNRWVAGISPDASRPGYRHVVFAPRPGAGIEHAEGSVESALGTVAISWRVAEGSLRAAVELPFGTTGTFDAPLTATSTVSLAGRPTESPVALGPGRHELVVTDPRIARAPLGDQAPAAAVGAVD